MECYIKDEVIRKFNICDIDFKNPRNFMAIEEMYFGVALNTSGCSLNVLQQIKINCLDFYIESVNQILTRFPLKKLYFFQIRIYISK